MLPRELQFELKPRRASLGLRLALAGMCLAFTAVALAWLVPQQLEVRRLQQAVRDAQSAAQNVGQAVPARSPAPAPWQVTADQDGKLFALTADARLLEVERCTDSTIAVRRLQFDEATGDATVEVEADGRSRLDALMDCLTGPQASRRWRMASVEVAQNANASGLVKVVIRR